jgi:hypothetical protein
MTPTRATTIPLTAWIADRESLLVRSWAERARAGTAEHQPIPSIVTRYCARHQIPIDPDASIRPVGAAILRTLTAIDAARRVAP